MNAVRLLNDWSLQYNDRKRGVVVEVAVEVVNGVCEGVNFLVPETDVVEVGVTDAMAVEVSVAVAVKVSISL